MKYVNYEAINRSVTMERRDRRVEWWKRRKLTSAFKLGEGREKVSDQRKDNVFSLVAFVVMVLAQGNGSLHILQMLRD